MTFHTQKPDLTPQEANVLGYLAKGLSNAEISQQMFLSTGTVKWYVRQLNAKLMTKNRKEIVVEAYKLGLLDAESDEIIQTALGVAPHNLPNDLTPFVGRETDLEQLQTMLADESVRLLTMTGLGGIGKTRLAMALARTQLDVYKNGVYFVPLVGKTSLLMLVNEILSAMDERAPISTAPEDFLQTALSNQHILLILDNFEQLMDAISYITMLLSACSKLKIIVTSRIRLNVSYERVYALNGLPHGQKAIAEHLLIDRFEAYQTQAGTLTPEDDAVQRIAHLVNGMPLALVLAASWIDTLTPDEIADEIASGIDILTSEQHDIPQRQRSIRVTLDYSWKRLSESEREAMMRLSVFVGGLQRVAAHAVAEAGIRLLKSLTQHSLLVLHDGRYSMHELVRQYAQDMLNADPVLTESTLARHAHYYAEYTWEKLQGSFSGDSEPLNETLLVEHDNLMHAWERMILDEPTHSAQRVIRAMSIIYQNYRTWQDTKILMEYTVKLLKPRMSDPTYASTMSAVYHTLGWANNWLGHYTIAEQNLAEADELDETLFEENLVPMRNQNLPVAIAFAHKEQGNYQTALKHAHIALERSTTQSVNGQETHIMIASHMLGNLYLLMGDIEQAKAYYEQGNDAVAELDGSWVNWWIAKNDVELAKVAYLQGNLASMAHHFTRYEQNQDASHDISLCGRWYFNQGQIAVDQHDYEAAEAYLNRSIELFSQSNYRRFMGSALGDAIYAQIGLNDLDDVIQDLQYLLEHFPSNNVVLLHIALDMAFLQLVTNVNIKVAKSLLTSIDNHPACGLMIRRRIIGLRERYHTELKAVENEDTKISLASDALAQILTSIADKANH
ncbi:MAG: LuxR C-terminal-related transcriptional regulator [Chloroflexota bacterium]